MPKYLHDNFLRAAYTNANRRAVVYQAVAVIVFFLASQPRFDHVKPSSNVKEQMSRNLKTNQTTTRKDESTRRGEKTHDTQNESARRIVF